MDETMSLESAQYRFWVEENIRNSDTDQFQHVNNAAIATYCEVGRMGLFSEPSISQAMAGLSIVIVKLTVQFERELHYPGTVKIGTRVVAIGNTSFQVAQGLYGAQGRFATSEATCVMMQQTQRKPVRVPDAVRALLMGHSESKQP